MFAESQRAWSGALLRGGGWGNLEAGPEIAEKTRVVDGNEDIQMHMIFLPGRTLARDAQWGILRFLRCHLIQQGRKSEQDGKPSGHPCTPRVNIRQTPSYGALNLLIG